MNLYEIESQYMAILDEVAINDGELTPELEEQLIITEQQLQGKSVAYLSVIKSNEAITNQIDEEIKRLQAMKNRATATNDYLKSRLLDAVKRFGAFEAGLVKFGTRKSSSIEVDNVNGLPKEFKVINIVESADKKKLKEAIQAGEEIEGVRLVENLNLKIN